MYGFLKNLKFFEPYLIIYLLGLDYSLFHIGILFAIRETITYLLEVPSGMIADYYGKKKELLMCFTFYIISFVFFFIGGSFIVMATGMIFFGLGEAFRSGTHKAMILSYLEHMGWYDYKGFVYGRTRSFSLIGSSISAFLSIILILGLPAMRWIFVVSIIPYIADFMLIYSYPDYLDERKEIEAGRLGFIREGIKSLKDIMTDIRLGKVVLSSASYDGVFKTIKDYIQPILLVIFISAGGGEIFGLGQDDSMKVYLGIVYGIFYIFSSAASRNIYRITGKTGSLKVYEMMYYAMGALLLVLSASIKASLLLVAIAIYFVLYIMMNARRPVFVDVSSDYMKKSERVTVLSIESQMRAILMVILAPTLGFLADRFSLEIMFMILGITVLLMGTLLKLNEKEIIR